MHLDSPRWHWDPSGHMTESIHICPLRPAENIFAMAWIERDFLLWWPGPWRPFLPGSRSASILELHMVWHCSSSGRAPAHDGKCQANPALAGYAGYSRWVNLPLNHLFLQQDRALEDSVRARMAYHPLFPVHLISCRPGQHAARAHHSLAHKNAHLLEYG